MSRYTFSANTVENKQSLKNYLANLSPSDTPILSKLGTSEATATVHEFVRYERARPTDNGATIEGGTATSTPATPPIRATNYVQSITEDFTITYEQNATSRVGGEKEFGFRKKDALLIWKMKLERSILLNAGAAGSPTIPRQMLGMMNGAGVVDNVATLGGTLTEIKLNQYLQKVWEKTNETSDLLGYFAPEVKSSFIQVFSNSFVRNLDATNINKVSNYVTYYESEYGILQMMPHRDMIASNNVAGTALIFSKAAYKVAYLMEPEIMDTTTHQSNSWTGKVFGMATLEYLFPKAAIKIYNISV
jgi:hypothetical protein